MLSREIDPFHTITKKVHLLSDTDPSPITDVVECVNLTAIKAKRWKKRDFTVGGKQNVCSMREDAHWRTLQTQPAGL